MKPRPMHVPSRTPPFKFMLRGVTELVVTAVVNVAKAVFVEEPFEGLDVVFVLANTEDHEQMRAEDGELRKSRALVILVELSEVVLKPWVGDQIVWLRMKLPLTVVTENRKDVR